MIEKLQGAGEIIFVPDKYLGSFASAKTGKPLIFWPGYCPTHIKILPDDILREKSAHPAAKVMVHPECHTSVAQLADEVLSTGGMLKYPGASRCRGVYCGDRNRSGVPAAEAVSGEEYSTRQAKELSART